MKTNGWLWAVLLIALGLAMLLKPEFLFKIEHFFTVKNGEPTDLYLILMRIGGAVFAVAGAAIALTGLL